LIELITYALLAFGLVPYVIGTDGYKKSYRKGLKIVVAVHLIIIGVVLIVGPVFFVFYILKKVM